MSDENEALGRLLLGAIGAGQFSVGLDGRVYGMPQAAPPAPPPKDPEPALQVTAPPGDPDSIALGRDVSPEAMLGGMLSRAAELVQKAERARKAATAGKKSKKRK
jgi:hypothetical protein